MSIVTLLFLSVALAMDAFTVSVSNGISIRNIKFSQAILIALFFGLFQAFMPVLGWLLGKSFSNYLAGIDHLIVFAIFGFIGTKMILEALQRRNESSGRREEHIQLSVLFALAVATSIDAFAVGISFSLIKVNILFSIMTIGIITFTLSFIGVYLGRYLGRLFGRRMELLGGLILIIIGFKILLA